MTHVERAGIQQCGVDGRTARGRGVDRDPRPPGAITHAWSSGRQLPGPRSSARSTCSATVQRVGVIGTGFIGASIGLALRRTGSMVLGVDANPAHLARCLELGAIDLDTDIDGISTCDAVVVAVPTAHANGTVLRVLERVGLSTTVIDVASVKASVAAGIEAQNYVGTHPMRGSHLDGPSCAVPDLFENATWLICPTDHSSTAAIEAASRLVLTTGATPIVIDADAHDERVARGSHLVHVVASALAYEVAGDRPELSFAFTGGGFRDATRVARAPAEMWTEVVLANAKPVTRALDAFVRTLEGFRSDLASGNRNAISAFFAQPAALLAEFLPELADQRAEGLR